VSAWRNSEAFEVIAEEADVEFADPKRTSLVCDCGADA
jgi:hypothetical protein